MKSTKFVRLDGDDEDAVPLTQFRQRPAPYAHTPSYDGPQQSQSWYGGNTGHASQYTYVQNPPGSYSDNTNRSTSTTPHPRRISRLSLIAHPVSNFRIPAFAAPWQHEKVTHQPGQSATVRYFEPKKQRNRLLVNGLLQWLITAAIACAMAATLYGFSRPDWLTRTQKYTFNAIITLLSLCLGLAIVTALRSYAKLLSWRLLAANYRNLQEFELIMNCDSQTKVLKLLWAGRTPGKWLNRTQVFCIFSILLVIGLQIVIGMLGLTYSIDSTDNYNEWVYGNTTVVDLSNICQSWNCTDYDLSDPGDNFVDQTGAANYYGLAGQNYDTEYASLGDGNNSVETIYTSDNDTYFYQFGDQSPDPLNNNVGATTRYVVQNTTCASLKIVSGGFVENNTLVWEDEHHVRRQIGSDGGLSETTELTTTYIGNGSQHDYCGDRCTRILVLNTGLSGSSSYKPVQPMLFGCNSTVGQVQNADSCSNKTACTLSNPLARIFAGAIGWQGSYWAGNVYSLQYKNYPPGSPWCWYDQTLYDADYWKYQNNPQLVASNIAMFTTNAIAAMDDNGPRITIAGYYPTTPSSLSVEWKYAIPIICVVPITQLIVLFIVCIWSNGAVVKDGSYLSAARLLRPVVEKLENHGGALTGDEIARELGNFKIIYGARRAEGVGEDPEAYGNANGYDPAGSGLDFHVGVIAESEGYGKTPEEGWNPGKRFPVGKYD